GRRPQPAEDGKRRAAELLRLLLDPGRGVHRPATEPTLEEVDACAREAGVRRAEEREQLLARAAEPREAQEREERLPERGLREPRPLLQRVRDAERAEHRLERRAPAVERVADDRDRGGGRACADQLEQLLRDG